MDKLIEFFLAPPEMPPIELPGFLSGLSKAIAGAFRLAYFAGVKDGFAYGAIAFLFADLIRRRRQESGCPRCDRSRT